MISKNVETGGRYKSKDLKSEIPNLSFMNSYATLYNCDIKIYSEKLLNFTKVLQ